MKIKNNIVFCLFKDKFKIRVFNFNESYHLNRTVKNKKHYVYCLLYLINMMRSTYDNKVGVISGSRVIELIF